MDRAGDEWTITVHGPGQVIVTDTTPNDGGLDDDIATIQIINSNLRTTYVTGTVSPRTGTDRASELRSPDRADGERVDRPERVQSDGQRDAGGDPEPGHLPLWRSRDAPVQ